MQLAKGARPRAAIRTRAPCPFAPRVARHVSIANGRRPAHADSRRLGLHSGGKPRLRAVRRACGLPKSEESAIAVPIPASESITRCEFATCGRIAVGTLPSDGGASVARMTTRAFREAALHRSRPIRLAASCQTSAARPIAELRQAIAPLRPRSTLSCLSGGRQM